MEYLYLYCIYSTPVYLAAFILFARHGYDVTLAELLLIILLSAVPFIREYVAMATLIKWMKTNGYMDIVVIKSTKKE